MNPPPVSHASATDNPQVSAESATPTTPPLDEAIVVASHEYVGRWNRLVSTTNWEKGRIIHQWRELILADPASAASATDDTWARIVGGVTGQHVGRLRRVFARFGEKYNDYPGLFWSHFQAALDWNDAEMWLEGASQSGWSVARLRNERWETLGRVETDRPKEIELSPADLDEDYSPEAEAKRKEESDSVSPSYGEATGPRHDGPDFGDDEGGSDREHTSSEGSDFESTEWPAESARALVQPFAGVPAELPGDVQDAMETFKIALMHHKTSGWKEISAEQMLSVLDALKSLVTAPADEDAPF